MIVINVCLHTCKVLRSDVSDEELIRHADRQEEDSCKLLYLSLLYIYSFNRACFELFNCVLCVLSVVVRRLR